MSDPQKKKSSTGKILLGCAIVAFLVVVGGGAAAYFYFKDAFVTEPAAVEKVFAESVPGAEAPAGYTGFRAMSILGVKVALLKKPDGSLIMAGSAPDAQASQIDGIAKSLMAQANEAEGTPGAVESEKLSVGGAEVVFQKQQITHAGGEAQTRYHGKLPSKGGRTTVLTIIGPEKGFDRAGMEAFLASIK